MCHKLFEQPFIWLLGCSNCVKRSAAYCRYNLWLLHTDDEDEIQVRLSFNRYFARVKRLKSQLASVEAGMRNDELALTVLALACIISCLSSPSHGCRAELCSAAYFRNNLWLLHINDEDELQVSLSFNRPAG